MSDGAPSVSIVVAVRDEEAAVRELESRLRRAMESAARSYELIFVDDGSRDGTAALLRELEAAEARVRVFEFTRSFGQAAALACGVFAASGDAVVTMDGDLQNPPEEIPALLAPLAGTAGVATGYRAQRYEGLVRWLGSRAVHWLACWLTGVRIRDFGGNFKAYRREVVEAMRQIWAPGKPLFPLALWAGYPVAEVTVRHDPRRCGRSSYTLGSQLRINFDLITSFTTAPLAWLGALGAVGVAVGAAGVLGCWWRGGPAGLADLCSVAAVAVGAVFVAAGILGQYVGRIYQLVASGNPSYVVKRGPLERGVAQPRAAAEEAASPSGRLTRIR